VSFRQFFLPLISVLLATACVGTAATPAPVSGVTVLPTLQSLPTVKRSEPTQGATAILATSTALSLIGTVTPKPTAAASAGAVSPASSPTPAPALTPRPAGVQIMSPISFAPIRARTALYFAVNALSPAGLQRVELILNDQVVVSEDARGETEYNLVYAWQTDMNGDYRFQARAIDSAGVVMQSTAVAQPVRGGIDAVGGVTPPEIGSVALVPEGTFRMGSDDGAEEEKPVHDVHVSGFQIDAYPVTVGQFRAWVALSSYKTTAETPGGKEPITRTWHIDDDPNRWEHPVRFVSWYDADHYCRAQGKMLPTEAQWEYAARGTDFRRYPWGNDFDPLRVPAGDTAPVGFFTSGVSPFGVYDMSGNVWEWTDDWFDPLYYRASDLNNPHPAKKSDQKSIRGGGFNNSPTDLRVARRIYNFSTTYHPDVGFRCVK